MIWNLSFSWLFMAIATVSILSFMFSLALNAIIGRDGFGPFGTTAIFTASFFGSIYAINFYGVKLARVQEAIFTGLTGAFIVLMTLLLLKAAVRRI